MDIENSEKFLKLSLLKEEMLINCEYCNHTGYLSESIECVCFKTFKMYVSYSYAGIDQEYWNLTFNDFHSDQLAKENALTYASNLENARKNGLGIVFLGENGRGKSMLANLILIEAKKLNYSIYFITFSELLEILKKSFSDKSFKEFYESKIRISDFLCIDNLGSEYRPKDIESFCVSELDTLSRYRRRNHFCTILTSNMSQSQLTSSYGKTINSLFSGCCKFINVHGSDWRTEQNKNWESKLTGK